MPTLYEEINALIKQRLTRAYETGETVLTDVKVDEVRRVLRPGGRLMSIGLDPHEKRDRWFVYDFFPETLELDLNRFPAIARRSAQPGR
jgi:ubiquinone/menaquinone biosynthesis C-methylase UbiE